MKTFLLSTLFVLSLLSCSHTQPIVDIVQDRSVASDDCHELVGLFFNKNSPSLEIPAASILGKNPDILTKIEATKLSSIDYYLFHEDFVAINKKSPTLRDALLYIERIKKITVGNYDTLLDALKKLPDANSEEIKNFTSEVSKARNKVAKNKEIKQFEQELIASYEHGKSTIPNIDTIIPLDNGNPLIDENFWQYLKVAETLTAFQGEYGELMAMGASKEKVLRRGLKFRVDDPFKSPAPERLVGERIILLETKVQKMSDAELLAFINPHRDGLFRMAYATALEDNLSMKNRTLVVSNIFDMIRSKEIDLITEDAAGKMAWGEVKAYTKPISLKVISGHGKSKTVADQLVEHKALRDVLGLETVVKLRFISPLSIVEDDARKLIESIGYEVVSAR